MAQFTVNIPDEYVARLNAVLPQGVTFGVPVIVQLLKKFLGERELRAFMRTSLDSQQAAVATKRAALEAELGINEIP